MNYYILHRGLPILSKGKLLTFDSSMDAREWIINHLFCDDECQNTIVRIER